MFENNAEPIVKMTNDPTSYIYLHDNNYIANENDIFLNPSTFDSTTNDNYGFVAADNDTNTIYPTIIGHDIVSSPQTNTATDIPIDGIYEMQFNPHLQNDGGANRSVTNNKNILSQFKEINAYPIGGVNNSSPAIYCTGHGYIKWYSPSKYLVLISCYYSTQASGTIISPTDIVLSHIDVFNGWQLTTNVDDSTGIFTLMARDGVSHIKFPTFMKNNLWYHHLHTHSNPTLPQSSPITSVIRHLTYRANYELWHHRLGHPGLSVSDKFHTSVVGVPHLKPMNFYACGSCMRSKFHNKSLKPTSTNTSTTTQNKQPINVTNDNIGIGQFLHMDYGFVRGSDYMARDNDGKLVTSIDKYRAYLLVIDKKSRFIWIFLTKTKEPPIEQIESLLSIFAPYQVSTITTDQGGELASSRSFIKMVSKSRYVLTPTGAYSSSQNGLAETPNKHLAQIMRNLLYSAGLGSQFWSYAMRHSVYLKNRWPHSSLDFKTPYEIMYGTKPNLSDLRIFGSLVHIKSSAKRYMKLDSITSEGLFMTYSGTDKVVIVVDTNGSNERRCTHLTYDEAHMSSTQKTLPPMGIVLQQAGYHPQPLEKLLNNDIKIRVKLLKPIATMPVKTTPGSAAYDIFSSEQIVLNPHQQHLVKTDIAVELPDHHYGQIKSRSGLAFKHQIHVKAGVIDSDYRGEIKVLLSNESNKSFTVSPGTRIAQMLILQLPTCTLEESPELPPTFRHNKGFGSTGTTTIVTPPNHIYSPPAAAAAKINETTICQATADDNCDAKYNVICSPDPFINTETIRIPLRGRHPTQGLVVTPCDNFTNRVVISSIQPGTSPRNIKRWIHRIKNSHLLKINDKQITSPEDVTNIFNTIYSVNPKTFTITVSNDQKQSLHHEHGVPMMYFDQLARISKHLHNIKNDISDQDESTQTKLDNSSDQSHQYLIKMLRAFEKYGTIRAAKAILPKNRRNSTKLTRRKLKKLPVWNLWQQSEFKQLDQYKDQQMFGEPCPLPHGANVLDLLWTYNVKVDGTRKARCVCNGQPKFKGTVIFGHTFAKMLDHVGSRIFWAAVASKNLIVRGADASNAFAEANAPDIPLYVRIDSQYREWYQTRFNKTIPDDYVLPVNKALQGHPESSRLWAKHMDRILTEKFSLKPTTHESCLYTGTYNNEEILFLRQVDDFAVAAKNENTAIEMIQEIDKYMTIDIKDLGRLTRYNGVDITQTRFYIKISNETYIQKLLNEHDWLLDDDTISNIPIPTKNDPTFNQRMESAVPPSDESSQRQLQLNMGFNYRQAIGELIFLMVTCRPDISYPLIKLSQYSKNPSEEHYHAVKHLFKYIKITKSDGIYFWRTTPRDDLPEGP